MSALIDVNDEDWTGQVLESKTPVLVDFWHEACTWCRRLEPVLSEVAKEFSGQLRFTRLNILASQANSEIGQRYGIMGTPTLIVFCNGRPIHQLVGYRPKETLRQEVENIVKTYDACFRQSTPVQR